jgi:hypothetical protein
MTFDLFVQVSWIRQRDLRIPMTYSMTSLCRCLGSGSVTWGSQWPTVWPLCAGVLDPAAWPEDPNDRQYDLSVQVSWIRQRDLRIPMTYSMTSLCRCLGSGNVTWGSWLSAASPTQQISVSALTTQTTLPGGSIFQPCAEGSWRVFIGRDTPIFYCRLSWPNCLPPARNTHPDGHYCILIWTLRLSCITVHVNGVKRPVQQFLNNLWGARNRAGIGLSYRPTRLHRLAEFVPWNRFLGSLEV